MTTNNNPEFETEQGQLMVAFIRNSHDNIGGIPVESLTDEEILEKLGGERSSFFTAKGARTNLGNRSIRLLSQVSNPNLRNQIAEWVSEEADFGTIRDTEEDILTATKIAVDYANTLQEPKGRKARILLERFLDWRRGENEIQLTHTALVKDFLGDRKSVV